MFRIKSLLDKNSRVVENSSAYFQNNSDKLSGSDSRRSLYGFVIIILTLGNELCSLTSPGPTLWTQEKS